MRNKNLGPTGGKRGEKKWFAGQLTSFIQRLKNFKLIWATNILILELLWLLIQQDTWNLYIAKSFQAINLGKLNHVKGYVLELSISATVMKL